VHRFIDPDGWGKFRRLQQFSLEPFRGFFIGSVQNCLTFI